MAKIQVGELAPDFELFDQSGKVHQLADYVGKWLLVYFYPKDNTPGCTTEACQLRDVWSILVERGAVILGVSADSVASHLNFANKFQLPFPLLADEDKTMIKDYGVLVEKSMFGKKFLGIKRSSFLINPEGKIAKIYPSVKPSEHAQEVLHDLEQLIAS